MTSQAAKKNRFADRVRAVEDFGLETEPISDGIETEPTSPLNKNGQATVVVGTKNKTIELRLDTIATLKNAVNWQKILGDDPQTEKDVIEHALKVWFEKCGYPRKA